MGWFYVSESKTLVDLMNHLKKRKKYLVIKRIYDIIFSFLALILLFPFLFMIAIIIKVDSKGTILFKQLRTGKDGKPFLMYKFRSMCENAEQMRDDLLEYNEMDGPVFKIAEDPRVTKFGRFIRRSSIDELPQLYNILRGEMSIVGPRPLAIVETKGFSDYENLRHLVKPGLTCYWQISGRNHLFFKNWIEFRYKVYKRDESTYRFADHPSYGRSCNIKKRSLLITWSKYIRRKSVYLT